MSENGRVKELKRKQTQKGKGEKFKAQREAENNFFFVFSFINL